MNMAITTVVLASLLGVAGVDQVVVYADRAQVTRATTVTCSVTPVHFSELPEGLDARTLRARVTGKAEVIGVASELVRRDESADQRVRELERSVEAAADRVVALDDAIASEQERLRHADSFRSLFVDAAGEQMTQARVDLGRWGAALSLLRSERRAASQKLVELNVERRAAQRAWDLLRRQLAHLQPSGSSAGTREAQVTLACNGAERITVSLSYVVPGASWRPEYDLRYVPSGKGRVGPGTVELTVAAVVQQATGEDWKGALLVLSTAKPRLGAEAPRPAPLYVNGREEQKGKVLVQATEERKQLAGPAARAKEAAAAADIEDRGQSFALTLPRR